MLKIPVFRSFGPNSALSDDKAMLYAKLRDDMSRPSEDTGLEIRWTPKGLSRMSHKRCEQCMASLCSVELPIPANVNVP